MNSETISKFNSVTDLRTQIIRNIESTEKEIEKFSIILGEKIRENQTQEDDSDFAAFKERLEGHTDEKKKEGHTDEKKKKRPNKKNKKNQDKNWYNLDGILIYNGIGIKGELEI